MKYLNHDPISQCRIENKWQRDLNRVEISTNPLKRMNNGKRLKQNGKGAHVPTAIGQAWDVHYTALTS